MHRAIVKLIAEEGVHHMQAHALTVLLTEEHPPSFPFLTLLVSGGHTLLLLASSQSDFEILATTKDTAIGDAFDKTARLLKLDWSTGSNASPGSALESLATRSTKPVEFPTNVMPGILAFSFSGLLSAADRHWQSIMEADKSDQAANVAAGFHNAAIGQLEHKIALALQNLKDRGIIIKSLVGSGGVASNRMLRSRSVLIIPTQVQQLMLWPGFGSCWTVVEDPMFGCCSLLYLSAPIMRR